MIDITSISTDLVVQNAQVPKAANVLQVQLGSLEYEPDFGVDLDFFVQEELQFQNESFKSYLIQRLAEHHVNVNEVLETLTTFALQFTFSVGETEDLSGGFIK